MKPLKELTRPNIWALAPYSSARDEYKGNEAHVFLDANENPYGSLNRYPDPLQRELKELLTKIKGVPSSNIFLGNGSDEAIDLVYRCFTRPGIDNVVAIEPTYGMYRVCADINDIEYRTVLLDEQFQLDGQKLLDACDNNTKVIWMCSPNNPTGNNLDINEMAKVITQFEGLVVVDEAYIDFSQQKSLRQAVLKCPNLIVLHTMSKAWGHAAIRLGMAFASEDIVAIMNKVKYPYNINTLTQQQAISALQDQEQTDKQVKFLIQERQRMSAAIRMLPLCEKVYPSDANFLLVKTINAQSIYDTLVKQGIIVRNRHKITLCNNCLRITIGTKTENNELLAALRDIRG